MKTTFLSLIISFLFSTFALGQQQPGETGFCEIWNNEGELVGVATRQGKIAQYDHENETYKVVGLSLHDNSVKLVKTRVIGRPSRHYLVTHDMGRTNVLGKIFDQSDRVIGQISRGMVIDASAQALGSYHGCQDLNFEERNAILAAAASRLLVFDLQKHSWERRFMTFCEPQHICRW